MKTKALLFLLVIQLSCIDDLTDARQKLVGAWAVDEECNQFSYTKNYSITIAKSSDENNIDIANFNNSSRTITATINDNNITIPNQALRTTESVSGSGHIDGNIITVDYTLTFSGGSQTCSATYSKK